LFSVDDECGKDLYAANFEKYISLTEQQRFNDEVNCFWNIKSRPGFGSLLEVTFHELSFSGNGYVEVDMNIAYLIIAQL